MKFRIKNKIPYLAQLGWTVESLEIAQSYGQILVSDEAEEELREYEFKNRQRAYELRNNPSYRRLMQLRARQLF